MKYNINVIKSVWRRLPKPSRVKLDAIGSQNSQKKPLTQSLDSAVRQHIAWLEADRLNLLTMAKTVARLREMNVIPGSEIINGLRDTRSPRTTAIAAARFNQQQPSWMAMGMVSSDNNQIANRRKHK